MRPSTALPRPPPPRSEAHLFPNLGGDMWCTVSLWSDAFEPLPDGGLSPVNSGAVGFHDQGKSCRLFRLFKLVALVRLAEFSRSFPTPPPKPLTAPMQALFPALQNCLAFGLDACDSPSWLSYPSGLFLARCAQLAQRWTGASSLMNLSRNANQILKGSSSLAFFLIIHFSDDYVAKYQHHRTLKDLFFLVLLPLPL